MAIPDSDVKLLWGRAAGICSNPSCRHDLTHDLKNSGAGQIGEMAHVIARKAKGPRGQGGGGADNYDNLILLCPSCHRLIDKSPADFPKEKLIVWKADHENARRQGLLATKVITFDALKIAVHRLLMENRAIFLQLGPKSAAAADPGSNSSYLWELRKGDTVIPNNAKIVNLVELNYDLVPPEAVLAFAQFKLHSVAFADHYISPKDSYPLFPAEFEAEFSP